MDLGVNLYGKGKSKQIKTILWYENLTKLHYKWSCALNTTSLGISVCDNWLSDRMPHKFFSPQGLNFFDFTTTV